jgi:hypothetical protein
MAIDNAEKRRSVSGALGVPLVPGVTPNSSKDAEWRQQSGWSYSGISIAAVILPGAACWNAGQVYLPGFKAAQVYNPGFKQGGFYNPGFYEADAFLPGFQDGETYNPGFQEGQEVC